MLKLFKKLFHRDSAAPAAATPRVRAAAAPRPSASRQPEAAPGVEVASLSLRAILDRLPSDLKAAVNQMPENDVKVILPVNAIMKQLPTGSVKMSLGSLVRQAPNGTFRKTNLEDKRMIEVPLGEIFKTINPGRLHRRNDQRQYDVPDDVQGLFGNGTGRNVGPAGGAPAPVAPPPAAQQPAAPLRMPGLPPSAPGSGVKRPSNGHSAPVPTPPPAAPGSGTSSLNLTGELSLLLVEIGSSWAEGIRTELSVLTGDTKLVLPVAEVSTGLQKGRVAFTWAQIRGWLTPAPSSPINLPDDTMLVLPLKIVAPAFVAATGAKRRETTPAVNHQLPDFFGPTAGRAPARPPEPPPVAEAAPVVETAPEPEPEAQTAPEPAVEETPRFLAPPEPVAPALSLAIEPAAPVAEEAQEEVAAAETPAEPIAGSLAELFNQPGKTDWSPNELVRLTCELPGVIGAVVALEEGLVVAQKLPEGLSSETFAAFMPQIFSRLDKYTGEMQLGDTEEVTVNTAGGPCRFFRRGKLFFATLGRSGETLPAGLHLVAAELASQNS